MFAKWLKWVSVVIQYNFDILVCASSGSDHYILPSVKV